MENEIKLENEGLLDSVTWSFSRLNAFYNCPYEWKLHYLDRNKGVDSSFGQFGSFCHKCLEMYAKGELDIFDISEYYEEHYCDEVTMEFPFNKYVDMGISYYEKGLDYFNKLDFDLDKYDILGVEKRVNFKIGKYDFVGYIDLLLREKESGKIIILDHKSASIKILKSGKISKSDQSHFLEFERQLYLYSKAVIEDYGRVDSLEWNMFKDQTSIKIPWNEDEYKEALKWAEDTIHLIENEKEWKPKVDFFYCNNLCSQRFNACQYKNGGGGYEIQ